MSRSNNRTLLLASGAIALLLAIPALSQTVGPPVGTGGGGGGGGSPGGTNTQIQYNNAGSFGGVSGVISNGTSMQFADGDLLLENAAVTGGASIHASTATGHTDFTLPTTSDTLAGIAATQTLTGKTISGASNTFSNIGNGSLTNSSVTIGTTSITLGTSSTSLAGLTSITIGAGSAVTSSGPGGALASGAFAAAAPCSAFGTTTGTCAQGGVITAGGPTGSATVAPIITYNAAGQLTTVTNATITPAIGSVTGLGTGVSTLLAGTASGTGGIAGTASATFSGTVTFPDSGTWGGSGPSTTSAATFASVGVTSTTVNTNGLSLSAAGGIGLNVGGTQKWRIGTGGSFVDVVNAGGPQLAGAAGSCTAPSLIPNGSTTTYGIGGDGSTEVCAVINGVDTVDFTAGLETINGNLHFSGTIPTATGTGTPTVTTGSTDSAGSVTAGTTATSVVITSGLTGYATPPFCVVTPVTQLVAFSAPVTVSAGHFVITITQTATTGDLITWHCDKNT